MPPLIRHILFIVDETNVAAALGFFFFLRATHFLFCFAFFKVYVVKSEFFRAVAASVSKRRLRDQIRNSTSYETAFVLQPSICPFHCFEVDPLLKHRRAHSLKQNVGERRRETNLLAIHL